MAYTVRDGKIQNFTCEINLTLHCNLSCRACSHMSPVAPKYFLEPKELKKDLSILSKYYHVDHVRLLGGEPLLHPNIPEIADIVLTSGITEWVRVVTNGVLLSKMEDSFWESINEVHITLYPGKEMTREELELCLEKSQKYNVGFQINPVNHFRECFSVFPNDDRALLNRIYKTCLTVHFFRSHTFHKGYLYKCPEALFLPMFLDRSDLQPHELDGIKIEDRADFAEDLLAYLENDTPPQSCKYCTGFVGKPFAVEYMKRKEWWTTQNRTIKNMLSEKDLAMLEWLDMLWKHFMFLENNININTIQDDCTGDWKNQKIFSTVFGQLFFYIIQRENIRNILMNIEHTFGIFFTAAWEYQEWYKIYL